MSAARVTVVTPAHDAERFLAETVASVEAQTMTDWALVLVDDCSSDKTLALMGEAAADDSRVTVVALPANGGVCLARNRGAEGVTSPYLMFLDADDVLEPAMLGECAAYLDAHPEAALVYTGHSYIDEASRAMGVENGRWPWARYVATRFWARRLGPERPLAPFESLFLVGAVIPSLALVRSSAFVSAGGFDESLGQGCEDTDFFLRVALVGEVHHISRPLVRYRRHAGQSTTNVDFASQYQKLTEKWVGGEGLGPQQRQLVSDALWFRSHRFYPQRQLVEAGQCLRRFQLRPALSKMLSFARTYSPRKPPAGLYR